jgi:hypothetical protein
MSVVGKEMVEMKAQESKQALRPPGHPEIERTMKHVSFDNFWSLRKNTGFN